MNFEHLYVIFCNSSAACVQRIFAHTYEYAAAAYAFAAVILHPLHFYKD